MATPAKKYTQTRLSFGPPTGDKRNEPAAPRVPAAKRQRNDKENQPTAAQKPLLSSKTKVARTAPPAAPGDRNRDVQPAAKHTSPSPAFSFKFPDPVEPPTFTPIPLQYAEDEIWARLQIREFVFRFGEHFGIDTRVVSSLQNVQGNWRVKRLSTKLALQLLQSMEQGHVDLPVAAALAEQDIYFSNARTLRAVGATVVREWMEQRGLADHRHMTQDVARIAFVEEMERDGLTASHWEDLAYVLLAAGFAREFLSQAIKDVSKLSTAQQISMLQMVCELLLSHTQLRRQWVMAETISNTSHNAALTELRVQRRRCENSDDPSLHDARLALEKRYLELVIASHKSAKRLVPAGHDSKGNEYWMFNDLVTAHSGCRLDARNSEPFWAYSVVVIGPGPRGQQRQWWHVSDIDDILQLRRWLETEAASPSTPQLLQKLANRVHYLRVLQWIEEQGRGAWKASAK